MYVNVPWVNTEYSVGDGGLTQKNFTTTLKNKLDGVATGATNTAAPHYTSAIAVGDGGLTQKNFTTTLKTKLDGVATGATNVTNNNQLTNGAGYLTAATNSEPSTFGGSLPSAYVLSNTRKALGDLANAMTVSGSTVTLTRGAGATNTSAPYYTSAIAVGDGGLTQNNFTNADHTKLNGIAAGATNTAAPHYTSAICVGDGGLTQKNFTTTLKSKLDGIATGANLITNNNQLTNGAAYITNSGGTTASTVNTVVKRDGSGDINVRLLRSEYDSTNSNIGYIMTSG